MRVLLRPLAALCLSAGFAGLANAVSVGQPEREGTINAFEIIGDSLVSAQQVHSSALRPLEYCFCSQQLLVAVRWYPRQGISHRQGGEQSYPNQRPPCVGLWCVIFHVACDPNTSSLFPCLNRMGSSSKRPTTYGRNHQHVLRCGYPSTSACD